MHRCCILAVGDELLDGRVSDTNSEFITSKLNPLGVETVLRITVGDDDRHIRDALALALAASDIVIVTGGLGPTEDDLTREAIANALGLRLLRDKRLEENLKAFFSAMGREMSPTNLKQADLLDGAEPIHARLGTAPGQMIEHEGKIVVLLPGVPREMRDMIEGDVIPNLTRRLSLRKSGQSTSLIVAARPESELAEQVQAALEDFEGIRVSYRAMMGQIEIRLSTREDGVDFERAERKVRDTLGPWVVAEGEETIEGNLGRELRDHGLTIAVAESITGGMVMERITRVAGSSDYFKGGAVAYTYEAKQDLLGVNHGLLESMGAINEEVAGAMARGARERLSSHIAIALTGLAGPDDGGERESVGTVAFALADEKGVYTYKYHLPGDREMVRNYAATILLTIAYLYVRGVDVANVR